MKISILLVGLVSLPALLNAQDAAPLKVRTGTNAVQVEVAVRDARRQPVPDLTRQGFKITDEGKPRPIRIFSDNRIAAATTVETPVATPAAGTLPPHVFSNRNGPPVVASHATVILLDGANGWVENFIWSRKTVIGLMEKVAKDERIAVYAITGNQGLIVLQDYTTDHDLLIKSVSDFVAPGLHPTPPGMGGTNGAPLKRPPSAPQAPAPPNATKESPRETEHALHLASENVRGSLEALSARLASIPGRKSVYWLTQGFPAAELRGIGKAPWDKTLTALNHANVAVNAVDSNGLGGPPRRWGRNATDAMQQIADETGGETIVRRNDLDEALAEGIRAARGSYTLGFYLADEERDGKFHRLAVSTERPNLQLQYRPGYFADEGVNRDSNQRKMPLESALLSPVDSPAIGITADVVIEPGQPHGTIRVRLNLDITTLKLEQTGDIYIGKIDEMFLELDQRGQQLGKVSDTQELQIPESLRAEIASHGVVLTQTFPLAEGTSRLSIIVRDAGSGQVGRLTVPLETLPK
jgi:VWFA-related protein